MFFKRLRPFLLATAMWLFLSGCAAAVSPLRIAAQPRPTPIAVYPPRQEIVYQAYIDLLVPDVDAAITRSARLAGNFGGYVSDSSAWYDNGEKFATLILAVPNEDFEGLRTALIGLGRLSAENTTGSPAARRSWDAPTQFSSLTLNLKPDRAFFVAPSPPATGWSPLQTLRRAFGVFLSIFGFILDVLIWVVVVGGPFILIGLAIWWLVRRRRTPDHSLNEKVDSA